MTLVRIVKNWDWPDLMRQTPGRRGIWDEIQFTVDPVDECDFLLILNSNMSKEVRIKCARENIWALMQEPYVKGFTDWMVESHEYFFRVYSHHTPSGDSKYMVSHPAVPWHINRSFDELVDVDMPAKPKVISWIVGNAMDIPGHFKRHAFLRFIQKEKSLDIDLYGRAILYINDKWDGLAPYKYSLAIENSLCPDYWTEKLADCFLTWTVPLYYGCPNLQAYFPEESFIRIDISQPRTCVEHIQRIIMNDNWEKRLPALKRARQLILSKYQLFPHLVNKIKITTQDPVAKVDIVIPAYKRSNMALFNNLYYKLKKIYWSIFFS
jgi:hypothetical protein